MRSYKRTQRIILARRRIVYRLSWYRLILVKLPTLFGWLIYSGYSYLTVGWLTWWPLYLMMSILLLSRLPFGPHSDDMTFVPANDILPADDYNDVDIRWWYYSSVGVLISPLISMLTDDPTYSVIGIWWLILSDYYSLLVCCQWPVFICLLLFSNSIIYEETVWNDNVLPLFIGNGNDILSIQWPVSSLQYLINTIQCLLSIQYTMWWWRGWWLCSYSAADDCYWRIHSYNPVELPAWYNVVKSLFW